jgi:prevent-host-death family protein
MTPTHLRANLSEVLDRIARTGRPVEIVHNGERFVLSRAKKTSARKKRTIRRPKPRNIIRGNPDDLTSFDWSPHWKPMV